MDRRRTDVEARNCDTRSPTFQVNGTKLLEAETPFGWYSAYSAAGRFEKPDLVEFLVKAEGVSNRGWDGDSAGPLVLYRSMAGEQV